MYLFERLIGVFTYVILLFVFFYLIQDGRIKHNKLLSIYLIILSILAFFYIPPESEDLYRTFIIVDRFKTLEFTNFIPTLFETSYPIAMLFYFIVSKTGMYGLIPAITTFITFGNVFYILKVCANKYELDNKQLALVFLFIMSTGMFGYLVTNIRALLSLSILARCFVSEMCLGKKISKNIVFYAISGLIHPLSFFVVAIRLIFSLLFEKNTKISTKIVVLFGIVLSFLLFKNYFKYAYEKFLRYFYEGTYFWIFEFIKILILDLFLFHIGRITRRFVKGNNLEQNNSAQLKNISNLLIILMIIICVLTEFNIYMRVSYFLSLFAIPILCNYVKNIKIKEHSNLLVLVTFLILFISCSRGHLSSFKFVLFD